MKPRDGRPELCPINTPHNIEANPQKLFWTEVGKYDDSVCRLAALMAYFELGHLSGLTFTYEGGLTK